MDAKVRDSRYWRDVALPWLTSLGVHALVVIAAVFAVRGLAVLSRSAEPGEAQLDIPDVELVAADLPLGTADAYLGARNVPVPEMERQTVDPTAAADAVGFAERPGDAFDVADADQPRQPGASTLIGAGAFDLATGGRGGPQARFGPGAGGGVPDGSVFRTGKPARSIVYVCDASGSMIDKFALLREQLGRSVAGLKPVQTFNVVFFRDEKAAALSDSAMLSGVAEQKRRAQKFVDEVIPAGTTDPLPALQLALRQRPELIFLLTDGDFPDNAAVLEYLRRHNAGGRVRINTIAFVERGDGYEQVLKTIAAENGGTFTHFAGDEAE